MMAAQERRRWRQAAQQYCIDRCESFRPVLLRAWRADHGDRHCSTTRAIGLADEAQVLIQDLALAGSAPGC